MALIIFLLRGRKITSFDFSPVFLAMYLTWFETTRNDPSDMAVHQTGSFGLSSFPNKYPNLSLIPTNAIHGSCDDSDLSSSLGKGCDALELLISSIPI